MNAFSSKVVLAVIGLTVAGIGPAWAQAPVDRHHQPSAAPAATPSGMHAPHGSGAMPMMDMCRQMMAGPMMGMSGDQKMDPKMTAHMLEMRGEMMRAMGEIMMKHGKMMQGGATK
jgi:hypothetical protein